VVARRDTLRAARQLACHGRRRARAAASQRLRSRLGDPRFLLAERQQHLDELVARLERQTHRELARQRAELEALRRRLSARHPRTVLAEARGGLGPLAAKLTGAIQLQLGRTRGELQKQAAQLDGLSPLSVLGRG
jgi:exodeoxyribonuclease VII large subunit